MSVSERLTLSNMAIECGAKVGLMEADEKTTRYLEGKYAREARPAFDDDDAAFRSRMEIDASRIPPLVSRPHSVDSVVPATDLAGTAV